MVFFYIATTLTQRTEGETFNDIKTKAFQAGFGGQQAVGDLFDPNVSQFKLGNLDSLISLNDQMLKLEAQIEGLLKKVERQVFDITNSSEAINWTIESIEGTQPIEKYIRSFKWDDKKFSSKNSPQDILTALKQRQELIDKDIRQKAQQYQDVKNNANALAKKEGSLFVRDLGEVLNNRVVQQGDFINTPAFQTVVAVVSNDEREKFLQTYQLISENVVPGSAKQFNVDDKDNISLWRIVICKKELDQKARGDDQPPEVDHQGKKTKKPPVEEFIALCRDKYRFTIREFDYNPADFEAKEKQRKELDTQAKNLEGVLQQACTRGFGEVYIVYMHLKRLRFIVDIAMRFGTQEKVCSILVRPDNGKEKKVVADLFAMFVDPETKGLYGTKEELEEAEDFYPFVYIPITIV